VRARGGRGTRVQQRRSMERSVVGAGARAMVGAWRGGETVCSFCAGVADIGCAPWNLYRLVSALSGGRLARVDGGEVRQGLLVFAVLGATAARLASRQRSL